MTWLVTSKGIIKVTKDQASTSLALVSVPLHPTLKRYILEVYSVQLIHFSNNKLFVVVVLNFVA